MSENIKCAVVFQEFITDGNKKSHDSVCVVHILGFEHFQIVGDEVLQVRYVCFVFLVDVVNVDRGSEGRESKLINLTLQ